MQIRSTLILLLLNVLLFAAIHFESRRFQNAQKKDNYATDVQIDGIESLEIFADTLPQKRILQKKRDQWYLLSPISWRANNFAVDQILLQLHRLRKEVFFPTQEVLSSGQSLADFGLEKPFITLNYVQNGSKKILQVGQSTQMGGRYYVRDPNLEHIMVTSKDLAEALLMELEALREPAVFHIPPFEIKTFVVKSDLNNLTVTLEKKSNSQWQIETPIKVSANTKAVDHMLEVLAALKAKQFLDPKEIDLAKFGLVSPSFRITLQGDSRQQTLLIGNRLGKESDKNSTINEYYAMLADNPTVFVLASNTIESLKSIQDKLRERRLFKWDPSQISTLEIAAGENEVVSLKRLENGAWKVIPKADTALQPFNGDVTLIEGFLGEITTWEVVHFKSDAPSSAELENLGFSRPRRIIHVEGKDTDQIFLITGDDTPGGLLYAKFKDMPSIYEVKQSVLQRLRTDALYYRDRMWQNLPDAAIIQAITLKNMHLNEALFTHKIENQATWEEIVKKLPSQQGEALAFLVKSIKQLRVQEYIAGSFVSPLIREDGTKTSWAYQLDVDYLLPGGKDVNPQRQSLCFTERLGGGIQIGGIPASSHGPVFYLTQEWIDALHKLTFKGMLGEKEIPKEVLQSR